MYTYTYIYTYTYGSFSVSIRMLHACVGPGHRACAHVKVPTKQVAGYTWNASSKVGQGK